MIFVTVGMQLAFDRLVNSVIKWSKLHGKMNIVFQVGPNGSCIEGYKCEEFLDSDEFNKLITQAEMVVSHAGMGTILKSLELAKPLIIMPRRAQLNEHRNDHQLHTAAKFSEYPGITTVYNEEKLHGALDESLTAEARTLISPYASDQLLNHIRQFIKTEM
ncbi:glycosyltransferase [Marispirochaeta sp.]|uniref:glycosyltransferase n=1 Tax=Marispirochaeta sp. TaxID=2038653 RepID=UPI0029C78867|nr:glycosyltransferase [Marispirochaeta sp.]